MSDITFGVKAAARIEQTTAVISVNKSKLSFEFAVFKEGTISNKISKVSKIIMQMNIISLFDNDFFAFFFYSFAILSLLQLLFWQYLK